MSFALEQMKQVRFIDVQWRSIRWITKLGAMLLPVFMLSACSSPRIDHSLCDLRVLSLQIPRQSADVVVYASPAGVERLKLSQEKFNLALGAVNANYTNHDGMNKILKDASTINANIDVLVKHQDQIEALQNFDLYLQENIPEIQAEYNLLTDHLTRLNYPSSQVIIAKNQVFVAERILRSMHKVTLGDKHLVENIDDFFADLETFSLYLEAQLKGNPELGVKRVKDAEGRESLLSIQKSTQEILASRELNLLSKREFLSIVYQAARENLTKSDELFNGLNELMLNTQSGQ
ncbi:pilus assembly protein PilJ [Acinetobacter proteolyticus]|uniref:pilus assembly protein PilJ n=1 Tax=Acinetobacter proteolyticus TaxID=1776741 RepID=UPI0008634ADF|nr:pilus assembly protein PilJ [Acinetobacter proteolyticus]OEY94318.1 pilus assembly protein PilJ [Acinetobacter proteolyticus]